MLRETFLINGMSCGHCVQQVKKIIESQKGVITTEVSLETNEAKVEYDEQITSADVIKSAVNQSEIYKIKQV